jgi:hypothetical protein
LDSDTQLPSCALAARDFDFVDTPGFTVTYRFGKTHYFINMKNEAGKSDQVFYLKADDHEISFSEAFREEVPISNYMMMGRIIM